MLTILFFFLVSDDINNYCCTAPAEDPSPPHSLALSVDRFGGLSELLKLESDGTEYQSIFKTAGGFFD